MVVGMISMVFYSSALHRTGTALINELIVAPGYRSKGIGTQLLTPCVDLAKKRGFDEIEVGVEKANTTAAAFYRRNGIDKEYILLGLAV
jgi:ribosomal protein S18 acetylase RimI-like enzyme